MANLKKNNLTSADIQEYCERIVYSALERVDPYRLILDNIKIQNNCLNIKDRSFDLNQFDRVHVLGAGKGAPFLFRGLKERLGDRIGGGIIVSLEEHEFLEGRQSGMLDQLCRVGSMPFPPRHVFRLHHHLVTLTVNDCQGT